MAIPSKAFVIITNWLIIKWWKRWKKFEKNRTKPYYLVLFENRTKPGTVLEVKPYEVGTPCICPLLRIFRPSYGPGSFCPFSRLKRLLFSFANFKLCRIWMKVLKLVKYRQKKSFFSQCQCFLSQANALTPFEFSVGFSS